MSDYKIIFSGPEGSGKTTAINSISDVAIITSDSSSVDNSNGRKSDAAAALEYGMMKINDTENIHLYGTPEQERFDFMWDILTAGGIGLVLLISNSSADPFADLKFFLRAFSRFISETKVVIGITNMDSQPFPAITDYHRELGQLTRNIPIFEVDVRRHDDIALLIEALLFSIEPGTLTTSQQLMEKG